MVRDHVPGVSRREQHADVRTAQLHLLGDVDPRFTAFQDDVRKEQRDIVPQLELFDRLGAISCLDRPVPEIPQQLHSQAAHVCVIFNDQNQPLGTVLALFVD